MVSEKYNSTPSSPDCIRQHLVLKQLFFAKRNVNGKQRKKQKLESDDQGVVFEEKPVRMIFLPARKTAS